MSALAGLGVALVKGSYELCRTIQFNGEDANHTLRRLERHQELVNELLREQNGIMLPPEYAAIFDEIQVQLRKVEKQVKKTKDANIARKVWQNTDFKRLLVEADNVIHELRFQQTTNQHRVQQQMLGTLQVGQVEMQSNTQEILLRTHALENELREVHRLLKSHAPVALHTPAIAASPPTPPIEASSSSRKSLFRRFSTRSENSQMSRPVSPPASILSVADEAAEDVDARLANDLERLGISAPHVLSDSLDDDAATIKLKTGISDPLRSLEEGMAAVRREKEALQVMPNITRRLSSASSVTTMRLVRSNTFPQMPLSPAFDAPAPRLQSAVFSSTSPATAKERLQSKQNERQARLRQLQASSASTASSAPVAAPRSNTIVESAPHLEQQTPFPIDADSSIFTCIQASADGHHLAVGGARHDKQGKRGGFLAMFCIQGDQLKKLAWLATDQAILCLAWSSDSQILVCGTEVSAIEIYRPRGLKATADGSLASKAELRRVNRLVFDTEVAALAIPGTSSLEKGAITIATHPPGRKILLFHRYWWKTAGLWSMETNLEEDKTSRYTVNCAESDEPTIGDGLRYVISGNANFLTIPGRSPIQLRDRIPSLQHIVCVAGGTKLLFLPRTKPTGSASFQLYDSHSGALISSITSSDIAACQAPLYGCRPDRYGRSRPLVYTADGKYGIQASKLGLFLRDGQASPLAPPLDVVFWQEQGTWDAPTNSDSNDVVLLDKGRAAIVLPHGGKELRFFRILDG